MILLLIGLILVIGFFVSSAILYCLSRLLKIKGASYRKSMLVNLLSGGTTGIVSGVFALIGFGILAHILGLLAGFFTFGYLFKRYYQVTWKKFLGVYLVNILVGILLGVLISLPVRIFLFEPFVVSGQSMSPHLNQEDYLVIEKFDRDFKRDDVVVFKLPGSKAYLIKRVIGLPSEKITIEGGELWINGKPFQDSYMAGPIKGAINITLANDEYFVLSDNPNPSLDSRTFGPVKSSNIVGKVLINFMN